MSTKERLEKILELTKSTYYSLAKNIGLKNAQNLYDIRDGKVKSISFELASLINSKYPEFNFDWLRTGKGEVKSNPEYTSEETLGLVQENNEAFDSHSILFEKERTIKILEKGLEDKDRMYENLLEEKDKRIIDKDSIITLLKQQLATKSDGTANNTGSPVGAV